MLPELAQQIASNLLNYGNIPTIATIIAGKDNSGSHIYTVYNGQVACRDQIGFAAIGAGAKHANSYLMFSGHNPNQSLFTSLFTTYSAKKRAEVAPGVGGDTDFFTIGDELGTLAEVDDAIAQVIEASYNDAREREVQALSEGAEKIREHFDKVLEGRGAKEQTDVPKEIGAGDQSENGNKENLSAEADEEE